MDMQYSIGFGESKGGGHQRYQGAEFYVLVILHLQYSGGEFENPAVMRDHNNAAPL